MVTKLSKVECDKLANEIAKQEYTELLKSGEKNELRTWFLTSLKVTDALAKKFKTNFVAFYYGWHGSASDGCTGTRYTVKKYKGKSDTTGELLFDGFATIPAFE